MPGSNLTGGSGERGTVPVVAVAVLLAVTVVLAAVVGGLALAHVPTDQATAASLSLSVRGEQLSVVHRGGDALDVRTLRLRVTVKGTPLSQQPPVPFFSAAGFRPGPTGPFNSAADPRWSAGEVASVRIAGTNRPRPRPGDDVAVTVYASGRPVAELTATARAAA